MFSKEETIASSDLELTKKKKKGKKGTPLSRVGVIFSFKIIDAVEDMASQK